MFRIATLLAVVLSLVGVRPVPAAAGVDEPADAVCRDADAAVGCPVAVATASRPVLTACRGPVPAPFRSVPRVVPCVYRHHREGGGGARAP